MKVKFIAFLLIFISTLNAQEIISKMDDNYKREIPDKTVLLSYNESIKNVTDVVVNISTLKKVSTNNVPKYNDPFFDYFFGKEFKQKNSNKSVQKGLGSGVIISSDGYIVTNNHVIKDSDQILVTLPNSKEEYEAKIIGTDPKTDLAVIKIKAKNLNVIKFANSSKLKVGDVVFAIGNPFGVGESVTSGIISALNKTGVGINSYENFIQTDASINPGNSGGALVDSRGALVGINTAIISKSGGNVGIGFAIPSNMVEVIASSLIKTGSVQRGYLGVSVGDITGDLKEFYNTKHGALVMNVDPHSPADKGGLKRGDLVISLDGKVVKDSADLRNKIGLKSPSSKISLQIIRDGKIIERSLKLASLENYLYESNVNGLAILNKVIVQNSKKGVVIVDVKTDSKAYQKGLKAGDIIVQIESDRIYNINDVKMSINKYKGKKRIYIKRNNSIWLVVCN
jgi:serine protease Do